MSRWKADLAPGTAVHDSCTCPGALVAVKPAGAWWMLEDPQPARSTRDITPASTRFIDLPRLTGDAYRWDGSRPGPVPARPSPPRLRPRAERPRRYHRPMRLIPWEEERLLIYAAAELARRRRAAGLPLNHPEAVALICDAMLEAARAGATYPDVEAAGRAAVDPSEVMNGVRELLDEVRLEVLLGDGSRVIALVDPLGRGIPPDPLGPGALVIGDPADVAVAEGRQSIELVVTSRSRRRIRVSSHYPFDRVNPRLEFNREAAKGFRLDIPAGAWVGWEPGETKSVRLVRLAGRARADP